MARSPSRSTRPTPDLVGTISGKFPGSVLAGAAGKATLTIKNQGLTAVTKKKITINLYLSESTTLPPHSTAFRAVPLTLNLKPQKTKRVALSFKYPTGLPSGNYFLVAKINPANLVPGTNKVDNVSTSPVTIQVDRVRRASRRLGRLQRRPHAGRQGHRPADDQEQRQHHRQRHAQRQPDRRPRAPSDLSGTTGNRHRLGQIHLKAGGTQRLKLRPAITAAPQAGTFLSATVDPSNPFHNPSPGGNIVTSTASKVIGVGQGELIR